MSMLHIDLDVSPDHLFGTATSDGQTWPVQGWLSLIGVIDRTRSNDRAHLGDPTDLGVHAHPHAIPPTAPDESR